MNTTTNDVSMAGSVQRVSWTGMAADEAGPRTKFTDYADRSVQVTGLFGGATVVIEGSNDDGTTYNTLSDPQGNALTITAGKIEAITELTQFLRARVIGGDGTTSINVYVVARKPRQ